jgi:predicted nucleotidyltransferase
MIEKMLKLPEARLIFGKKELEIIHKQLKGLPLTQSQKNRLSTYIRPKLEFIKKLQNAQSEFKLKKNQTLKIKLQQLLQIIKKDELFDCITAILLFGSYANNTARLNSDIDVAIIFESKITDKEATLFQMRILGETTTDFDIQVFNFLPTSVQKTIRDNHKILYKKSHFDSITFKAQNYKDDDFILREKRQQYEK